MGQLVLRGFDPKRFFERYWQKRPGFLPQGLPEAKGLIDADTLAGMALHDDVESRLVWEQGPDKEWQVLPGPFAEHTLQNLPAGGWSLLVQGVEQHIPKVAEILRAFSFIPRWRLDDIMISIAPPGGSVGPHYDLYDVFLVQVQGQRTWHIGDEKLVHPALKEGTDLRILRDMPSHHTRVVKPGDVLYVPPHFAHWGVADSVIGRDGADGPNAHDGRNELSLTLSVGFRAPLWRAVADQLGALIFNGLPLEERWQDDDIPYGYEAETTLSKDVLQRVVDRFGGQEEWQQVLWRAFAETVTGSVAPALPPAPNLTKALRERHFLRRNPAISLVEFPWKKGLKAIAVQGETLVYPSRLHKMVSRLLSYEPIAFTEWSLWWADGESQEFLAKLWESGGWMSSKKLPKNL